MAPWTSKKLGLVPITMGTILIFGIIVTFIIAVANKNVTPYMPFISEAGGNPPEGGIFSIFLYLSSMIGLFTLAIRFMIVSAFNQGSDNTLTMVNWISIFVGILSIMGMVVVAAYPMTVISLAHDIGAYTLFLGSVTYGSLQTFISYRMSPSYGEVRMCRIRLALIILGGISLIMLLIFYPIAVNMWFSVPHKHWKGSKVPGDKGFDLLVVSSTAEWMMAIIFVLYYFSFFSEFQNAHIHMNVQFANEDNVPG